MTITGDSIVIDALYVLGTIGFFALMLVYVRGCARLGEGATIEAERPEEPNR